MNYNFHSYRNLRSCQYTYTLTVIIITAKAMMQIIATCNRICFIWNKKKDFDLSAYDITNLIFLNYLDINNQPCITLNKFITLRKIRSLLRSIR